MNVLRLQSRMGEIFYYQWPDFYQVILEGLQIDEEVVRTRSFSNV